MKRVVLEEGRIYRPFYKPTREELDHEIQMRYAAHNQMHGSECELKCVVTSLYEEYVLYAP